MNDWLTHRAAATPDDLALIDTNSDTRWSYSGLDAAVDETAGRLAALGIEPGDHVGMLMSTQLLSVCLLHAAQRLGLRLVPLNDRLTPSELAGQIDHSDLSMLVCGADTEQLAVESSEATPVASVNEPQWEEVQSFRAVEPEAVEPVDWAFDDPQLMVFTSGSTGEPKAVVLTMGNLLASAAASAFRLGVEPDDRWLMTLALYHVGGIAPILRSTLYGTAVVLRSGFDPGEVADDIERYDVTVVSLVPTMLSEMLERRGTLSDSLRAVLLGGAPAPDSLIERCRNYSIPVFPTYGMTETASQIATARPQQAFKRSGTVGRPLMWTDLSIVDDGEPVGPEERGEIVVAGPMVTAGYYGDVDANVDAFCEHGLRTGDIGYTTDNGYLYVLNRIDDRIITGGENVDPGEVVEVLRSHPDVDETAVVGVDDETWGERVSALVVPKTETLSATAIESFCRERLAGYKLPRQIAFTDSLPRTASGTIKRPAVRDQLAALGDADSETTSDAIDREPTPRLPDDQSTEETDGQSTTEGDDQSAGDTNDQSTAEPQDEQSTMNGDEQSTEDADDQSTADPHNEQD
jgi:O-succinylbenzoic acid--CoA ligase